jgi:hypothetical protein
MIKWKKKRGIAITRFEVDTSGTSEGPWSPFNNDLAAERPFTLAAAGHRAYFRLRACNATDCSGYNTGSVTGDCAPAP